MATDVDPRFLRGVDEENVEVWEHDILTDDLQAVSFDLVHCRALLRHLPEPERALARMTAALRPGGWLLVDDAYFTSFGAADPEHPLAATFDRVTRALLDQTPADEMDANFGARLPALVGGLGLVERAMRRCPSCGRGAALSRDSSRTRASRPGPACWSGVCRQPIWTP